MAGRGVWSRKFLGGLLIVFVLGCAAVAWRERSTLLSWFYLHNLTRATPDKRERWVERVANLGETAIPGLFNCLTRPDAQVCDNARAVLERMTHGWGSGDARTVDLALRLAREFTRFSPAGQRQALNLAVGWFTNSGGGNTGKLVSACSRLVGEAAGTADAEVQTSALELCGILLSQPDGSEVLRPGQDLIRAALHSSTVENRLRAIRLTLHPGMADLLEQVVVLLNDESPLVRRAALLTVGPARGVIHDDQLLPCLHDPDPEVRHLCEAALGGRGLRPEYLELGRLLTDPQPATRLQVLDRLRGSTELDPGLWLRRLSHDPSPSVRVAAMRAMTQQSFVDLSDRIDQMARTDPSPTVCQLAHFYLNCPRPRAHTSGKP
ncbi:MAG TPA: HEAT repeat domain-containing protein [Gemmataceae bacterium]|nr:HEAT repeat domain-containing protein [Gemmataceae bacterium]